MKRLASGLLLALAACTAEDGSNVMSTGQPAAAAQAGPIRLVGCRQGGCLWERRLSARVLPGTNGALHELVADTGESRHPDGNVPDRHNEAIAIDWNDRRTTYVRCSTAGPLVAFRSHRDTELIVHHLDLFETAGYNYGSARIYMRTCHDRDFVEDEQVLRGLGYRPGTRNEQVEGVTVAQLASG